MVSTSNYGLIEERAVTICSKGVCNKIRFNTKEEENAYYKILDESREKTAFAMILLIFIFPVLFLMLFYFFIHKYKLHVFIRIIYYILVFMFVTFWIPNFTMLKQNTPLYFISKYF